MNNPIKNQDFVSGIVDSIIFTNEENGYTVCELEDSEGQPVVVTGIIPYLTEGDKITVWGEWTNHQTYGRQFKAESFEKSSPQTRPTFSAISPRVLSRASVRKQPRRSLKCSAPTPLMSSKITPTG